MVESWLHEAVSRERHGLLVTVGYMKLFVVRDLNSVCDGWLHEAVCRRRPELWVTFGYIKLCVDRDLKCG